MNEVDVFLEHHGVKGMKWGQRKRRDEAARRRKFSPEAKRAAKVLDKAKTNPARVKSLSNQEIRDFNDRIRLEQQFSQLRPQSNAKKVRNFIGQLLGVNKTLSDVATLRTEGQQSIQTIRTGKKPEKKK